MYIMGGKDDLYLSVPSFFRCPISLDVMKSPVSLSTGVTYDRSSIQRWLENGNNTCPATMQVLDSKDFVPNHTLQRLIQIWSNNHHHHYRHPVYHSPSSTSLSTSVVSELIKQLMEMEEEEEDNDKSFESFVKILCFASESPDNRRFLAFHENFVRHLIGIVSSSSLDLNPDVLEAVLKILHLLIVSKGKINRLDSSCHLVSSLARILRAGRSGCRVAAAGIIETFAQNPETKKPVLDHQDLVTDLLQILEQQGSKEEVEIEAVLSCLIAITTSSRTNKQKLVRAGGVKTIGRMITTSNDNGNIIEMLLTLLEMLAGYAEGRSAVSDDPNCVPMIINKLMKVSKSANEHGVALLWSLCYLFRDQRAKEVVMRSNGGLTKILLLMQSDCSPAVKRMCCDLLRIFRVNSKSCLSSYDTKTTHIMPC